MEKLLTGVPGGRFFALTGQISVALMFAALFQTPAERLLSNRRWVRALRPYRRHLGVASFLYAALHLLYWLQAVNLDRILESFTDPVLYTGWLPFIAMTAMAVTSNNASVRKLRANWTRLQSVVYVVAPLVVLHWYIGVSFQGRTVLLFGALLLVWALLRLAVARPQGAKN